MSFLPSLSPLSANHNGRECARMTADQLCGAQHTVSPCNPFFLRCVGEVRGASVVDVGHAEYRANAGLAAVLLLHSALRPAASDRGTLLCAIGTRRHALHVVATQSWHSMDCSSRVRRGGSKLGLRPQWRDRGETGGSATQCLQPSLANMSAMSTTLCMSAMLQTYTIS